MGDWLFSGGPFACPSRTRLLGGDVLRCDGFRWHRGDHEAFGVWSSLKWKDADRG